MTVASGKYTLPLTCIQFTAVPRSALPNLRHSNISAAGYKFQGINKSPPNFHSTDVGNPGGGESRFLQVCSTKFEEGVEITCQEYFSMASSPLGRRQHHDFTEALHATVSRARSGTILPKTTSFRCFQISQLQRRIRGCAAAFGALGGTCVHSRIQLVRDWLPYWGVQRPIRHHLPTSFHSSPLHPTRLGHLDLAFSHDPGWLDSHMVQGPTRQTPKTLICMQPNTTSSRIGPTTKATKHDHLHELSLVPSGLHSLAI